jgi:recombination protein RecA
MPPGKKQDKPEKPRADLFAELSAKLSALGGKKDKDGEWIRQPAPVLVAGREDGEPLVRLPGVISTRIATLDAAIGVGGIPMARITTVAGGEGVGKTTLAGLVGAECQSMGGVFIYIDNEHKLDLDYFKLLGVDLTKMLMAQPGTIEDSFNIYNEAVLEVHRRDPDIPVFGVLDSINASKSEKEYEEDGTADFTESNQAGLGAQARIMSERLPKLARLLSNRRAALMMISQPRDNIGGYGGKNLVAGGNAPRFYSALCINLIHKGKHEESGKQVGNLVLGSVFKNQVARPHREGQWLLRWGVGVDTHKALIDQCITMGLVNSGSAGWFEMHDPALAEQSDSKLLKWQGNRGWNKLIQGRPEILTHLQAKVREPFKGLSR